MHAAAATLEQLLLEPALRHDPGAPRQGLQRMTLLTETGERTVLQPAA
ncbi:MAG: hypothetical protein LBJ15_02865 [Comamonas sp.]|jgi:hypothetical protein|nr:hypothetical protein [Comamonas sp.]MDR0212929.1 hypothetical protein [Comamonas sp.]